MVSRSLANSNKNNYVTNENRTIFRAALWTRCDRCPSLAAHPMPLHIHGDDFLCNRSRPSLDSKLSKLEDKWISGFYWLRVCLFDYRSTLHSNGIRLKNDWKLNKSMNHLNNSMATDFPKAAKPNTYICRKVHTKFISFTRIPGDWTLDRVHLSFDLRLCVPFN